MVSLRSVKFSFFVAEMKVQWGYCASRRTLRSAKSEQRSILLNTMRTGMFSVLRLARVALAV